MHKIRFEWRAENEKDWKRVWAASAITERKSILIEKSRAHTKSRRVNFISMLEKLLKLNMNRQLLLLSYVEKVRAHEIIKNKQKILNTCKATVFALYYLELSGSK